MKHKGPTTQPSISFFTDDETLVGPGWKLKLTVTADDFTGDIDPYEYEFTLVVEKDIKLGFSSTVSSYESVTVGATQEW